MGSKHTDQAPVGGAVTIRKLSETAADREAIDRLAERDSHDPLEGAVLVAEIEGEVVAAVSLADGASIADPFSRTDELRSLLELRAAQLRRRVRHSSRRAGVKITRRRARAALASSPPGAGGKLLELPH